MCYYCCAVRSSPAWERGGGGLSVGRGLTHRFTVVVVVVWKWVRMLKARHCCYVGRTGGQRVSWRGAVAQRGAAERHRRPDEGRRSGAPWPVPPIGRWLTGPAPLPFGPHQHFLHLTGRPAPPFCARAGARRSAAGMGVVCSQGGAGLGLDRGPRSALLNGITFFRRGTPQPSRPLGRR